MAKKQNPEEMRLAGLIKELKDKAKKSGKEMSEGDSNKVKEWKRQLGGMKFRRLVEKRVQNALKQIGNVAALAGKNYTYTGSQAQEVVKALALAVDACNAAYMQPTKKSGPVFTLSA